MSWLRIDDGFPEHRKLVGLKRSERWTWLEVLAYCARQGNDGVLPAGITDVLKHVTPAFILRCVSLGLLDKNDGVLTVHDWATYNPKDPTKSERMARWRAKNKETVDGDVDTPVDGAVDENGVYKNVYETAPRPVPYPSSKGSTVTATPTHPVVPGEEGGDFEPEHPENEFDLTHALKDMPAG